MARPRVRLTFIEMCHLCESRPLMISKPAKERPNSLVEEEGEQTPHCQRKKPRSLGKDTGWICLTTGKVGDDSYYLGNVLLTS